MSLPQNEFVDPTHSAEAKAMDDAKNEIHAVLEKYDCAGVVVISIRSKGPTPWEEGLPPSSPVYGCVHYRFDPSYSKLKHVGDFVRMSVSPEDYGGDLKAFLIDCSPSVSMLASMSMMLSDAASMVAGMAEDAVQQSIDIAAIASAKPDKGSVH